MLDFPSCCPRPLDYLSSELQPVHFHLDKLVAAIQFKGVDLNTSLINMTNIRLLFFQVNSTSGKLLASSSSHFSIIFQRPSTTLKHRDSSSVSHFSIYNNIDDCKVTRHAFDFMHFGGA